MPLSRILLLAILAAAGAVAGWYLAPRSSQESNGSGSTSTQAVTAPTASSNIANRVAVSDGSARRGGDRR